LVSVRYPGNRTRFASFKYCLNEQQIYTFIPVACIDNIRELMANKCPQE